MTAVRGRCHRDEFCCFTDMNCLRDTTGTKHLDERRRSMRKAASFSRWSLLMGVACGLALFAYADRAARAESIDIMISGPGFSFDLGAFQIGVPTTQNFGSVDTSAASLLNSTLVGVNSAYQFSAIGGTSDFPGGFLRLTGEVYIPAGATGSTTLTITETEMGFTLPSGPLGGTLTSSTSSTYSAGSPNTAMAQSTYNLGLPSKVSTSLYTITPPPPSLGVNPPPVPISSLAAVPYSLTNVITISLVPPNSTTPVSDGFSVQATVTAVPEPASVVTMLIGLPLSLVGLAWLRRRTAV